MKQTTTYSHQITQDNTENKDFDIQDTKQQYNIIK